MTVGGILLLDKLSGPTSHDAVVRVRQALGVRRVGHFGTLDPFASGLLVLGVGPATRLGPYVASHGKRYRAVVRLGARSTTDDREGDVDLVADAVPPSREAVEEACARWTGAVDQTPPVYSAKRVGGGRAYARARAGEVVGLPPVAVKIERLDVIGYDWPDLEIDVVCGPGTYIRALARDLGDELGTGGYCASLRRLRSGPFDVDRAIGWSVLDEPAAAQARLLPAETAIADLATAHLTASEARAAGQGRAVPVPGDLREGAWVRLTGPAGLIGVGEVRGDPDGVHVQPRTVLFPIGANAG